MINIDQNFSFQSHIVWFKTNIAINIDQYWSILIRILINIRACLWNSRVCDFGTRKCQVLINIDQYWSILINIDQYRSELYLSKVTDSVSKQLSNYYAESWSILINIDQYWSILINIDQDFFNQSNSLRFEN